MKWYEAIATGLVASCTLIGVMLIVIATLIARIALASLILAIPIVIVVLALKGLGWI